MVAVAVAEDGTLTLVTLRLSQPNTSFIFSQDEKIFRLVAAVSR
jgi:hypothetical protein